MIAICDCNYFYVACQELIHPELWNKPVVVMGNNNEVVVSLNKYAKKVGLQRGMLKFQNQHIFRNNGVVWFPSNYEFYYDISDRVMICLSDFVEIMEVSSIDEAFLSLDGFQRFGYKEYCENICYTVKKNVGVPISIGVSDTKTLSKIANRFAKKDESYNGVYVIDSEEKRIECLKETKIKEVWGIGDDLEWLLHQHDIFTAYDFVTKVKTEKEARKLYNVNLARTWLELQGIRCFPFQTVEPAKKGMTTSRSFPGMVEDKDSIRQAVSTFAAICASNLRKQRSYAAEISVHLYTNRFRKNLPQYNPSKKITLPFPVNTSANLVKYALQGIDEIFVPGFQYKKARIDITEITNKRQTNMFTPIEGELKFSKLNDIEDYYSLGFDRKLFSFGVMGYGKDKTRKKIDLQDDQVLKCPTTRFKDIFRINCTKEICLKNN